MEVNAVSYYFRVNEEAVREARRSITGETVADLLMLLSELSAGRSAKTIVDFIIERHSAGANVTVSAEPDMMHRRFLFRVDVALPIPTMQVHEQMGRNGNFVRTVREDPDFVLPMPGPRVLVPAEPPAPPQEPAPRRLNFRRLKSISPDSTGG